MCVCIYVLMYVCMHACIGLWVGRYCDSISVGLPAPIKSVYKDPMGKFKATIPSSLSLIRFK